MRPEDTQRCVPDPDWETPEQQFDIALAKKQAEIDEKAQLISTLADVIQYAELRLDIGTHELEDKIKAQQADIAELVDMFERIELSIELNDLEDEVNDLINKHRGK